MFSQMAARRAYLTHAVHTAALLGCAVGACDSPSGPVRPGSRVAVGQIVRGSVTSDSTVRYSFESDPSAEYAVYLEAGPPGAGLTVLDSATGGPLGTTYDASTGTALHQNATNNFAGTPGRILFVELRTYDAGPVPFQFQVYRVELAPEQRPARFTIGDTVDGEVIDPLPDVDQFVASGRMGQELVGWINALGPAAQYSASVSVTGPANVGLLADAFGFTPSVLTSLSQRFTLPLAGDYVFRVPAYQLAGDRFTGAYRFRFYEIDRAPESANAVVPPRTEIREAIDVAGDVDEFTFAATDGQEFVAYIQSSAARPVFLVPQGVIPADAAAASGSSDTALFRHGTSRFTVVAAGSHGLRVSSDLMVSATGSYRLFLYPVVRAPELVAPAVSAGDTVSGETIELPADVDEFLLTGSAGDEYNVFFEAPGATVAAPLALDVVDPNDSVVARTRSVGAGADLLQTSTGRFALPISGAHRLRVYAMTQTQGPYRLFVYPVDRRPESLPDVVTLGDSLSGEAIDFPGDVDEFIVNVSDSSGANILIEPGPDASTGLMAATVRLAATGEFVAQAETDAPGELGQTGRFSVAPGAYRIVVSDGRYSEERSNVHGTYRLWLNRFRFGPEAAPDTIVVGDTIPESMEPLGDVDIYHFYGVRGQHVNVTLQGMAPWSPGGFQAALALGNGPPFAIVSSPASSALGDHQTNRIDLDDSGWYRLTIIGERGPYRVALEHRGTAPEGVDSALVPGDSVTDEAIDPAGDWDQYGVTALPGQDLSIGFTSSGSGGNYAWVVAFDPASGDSLAVTVGQGERIVGPFPAPPGGRVDVAVFGRPSVYFRDCYDAECNGVFPFTGGYRLRVIPINRAPESVPPAYTVGDTVRGEAIAPLGDVDEFTSSGTPGALLTPYYHLVANPVPPGGLITLHIVNPVTGAILVGQGVAASGAVPGFMSPGSFVVPPGGTFVIRVRGGISFNFDTELGTAPYEFVVKP